MRANILLLVVILAVPGTPVLADVTGPSGKTIECYCTDSTGDRVELGETICLNVNGRMFMAQCQMSLNNPMWREVREGCLSSELAQPPLEPGAIDPQIVLSKPQTGI